MHTKKANAIFVNSYQGNLNSSLLVPYLGN